MTNILKSLAAFLIIVAFQFIIYFLFTHSMIIKWGATDDEVNMPLMGDKPTEVISSTRTIEINKSAAEIWTYLAEIGADRKDSIAIHSLKLCLD
jgi:hypothetical protein